MIDQQYAKNSKSVLLNISGILRWATPKNGGWNVEATFHNGTVLQEYHTYGGSVVWSVNEMGGYPDKKEFELLEAEAMNKN